MAAPGSHDLRRAVIGGYRVADVEVALASLRLALSQVQIELDVTRRRLAAAEGRRADEALQEEAILRLRREQDGEAQAAADERLAALEAELARYRRDADDVRRIRERLTDVIRELARELDVVPTVPEAVPEAPAVAPVDVFDTAIELEAWPFGDLAALMAFEASLHELPGVTEVYIRGFEGSRATIALALDQPSPLLHEMALSLPYRLDVRSQDPGHIAMAVEPSALPA
jgi:hypothetical protein